MGSDWAELAGRLNWVDWVVVAVVGLAVVSGLVRGFLRGLLDILGVLTAFGVAVAGYRSAAGLALRYLPGLPEPFAYVGSFLGLVVIGLLVYGLLVQVLFLAAGPLAFVFKPLTPFNILLGAIPGLIKGLFYATLLLLPFAALPLVPSVSADIERSEIARRLVAVAINAAPTVESLLGRELNEGLSFLTPPQTGQGFRVNFTALGQLTVDPEAEVEMLNLLNQERARAGLPPLVMDETLRQVARQHSREMFELGYFGHDSPVTGSPADRLLRAGVRFRVAGENLAYAPNVRLAHEGLMNSPEHRANILNPQFRRVGIGAVRSELRGTMFTQDFTD